MCGSISDGTLGSQMTVLREEHITTHQVQEPRIRAGRRNLEMGQIMPPPLSVS